MGEFVPRTGAFVDTLRRREPLTLQERKFAEAAMTYGCFVYFSKAVPLEDDEDFEPYLTYELGVEEMVGDKLACQVMAFTDTMLDAMTDDLLLVQVALLRANFDRLKAEAAA